MGYTCRLNMKKTFWNGGGAAKLSHDTAGKVNRQHPFPAVISTGLHPSENQVRAEEPKAPSSFHTQRPVQLAEAAGSKMSFRGKPSVAVRYKCGLHAPVAALLLTGNDAL